MCILSRWYAEHPLVVQSALSAHVFSKVFMLSLERKFKEFKILD